MASNKELEAGLKAMVEDYHLPGGGRKKLSQLVAGHLAWLQSAKQRGIGWRDMIGVLTAAGVTRRGGKPLTSAHSPPRSGASAPKPRWRTAPARNGLARRSRSTHVRSHHANRSMRRGEPFPVRNVP